jgi:hypothetical protein
MYSGFWLESLEGRDHEEDLYIDGSMTLKWVLGEIGFGGCELD